MLLAVTIELYLLNLGRSKITQEARIRSGSERDDCTIVALHWNCYGNEVGLQQIIRLHRSGWHQKLWELPSASHGRLDCNNATT